MKKPTKADKRYSETEIKGRAIKRRVLNQTRDKESREMINDFKKEQK